jgi:hypothetical protein
MRPSKVTSHVNGEIEKSSSRFRQFLEIRSHLQRKYTGKSVAISTAYHYAKRNFGSLGERFGGGKDGREGRRPSAF